ncbi:MAG: 4-hydroxy-tetrahydrodipicolinate reductase [Rhodospirillaceae bacterium]|jgi:4-hydroxy-tetrahydrodipicolinate reductase|nr:4-hydroxy-tetrahydrodipicolinate reductase [Rhodospirillaceae bacterium]MBT5243025.1 4-hydroxy-tetrahydrodipicolinate reductase [Rhodospirillaceae bacterium]MBT5563250.1 4-hydroxy-tetrahydrodipicolinate reductase [Rhodospirillaceae bacterium]MBT6243564.1 4-hydroxy-tetrahydrodipicolinate reductase [Rhodospirillaceae bacterium]
MKVGIVGCAGRMGRMLVAETLATDGCALIGGTEHAESPFLGSDLAALAGIDNAGLVVGSDTNALFAEADVVIDFTLPQATIDHADAAVKSGTALVLGTTGLGVAEQMAIEKAAESVTVIQAANYSVGVNLLMALTTQVSGLLDNDYDIEIVEMHHRHKVDAPSGTALALGQAAADGRGVDLQSVSERVRDGHTGERTAGDIGFATLRGGDVVGEHSVVFAAEGERIELTHKASSRTLFARGAVRSALWCEGKPAGLYSMADVLGL